MKIVSKMVKKVWDKLMSKAKDYKQKKQDAKELLDSWVAMMSARKKQKMDYLPLKEFKKSKKKSM